MALHTFTTIEQLDCVELGNEKRNLPNGVIGQEHGAEEELERIAAKHRVSIEKDPKAAWAAADASSPDSERDFRGGDRKQEQDTALEPPD
ncbi:hypothetical protein AAFP32_13090 [Brevibacterium sp. CBA3109]|uniref:Uncharacterized protein n=1 Tax=Brevibacterium koreense TaxID=3140787 RepID=A0AAU7UI62_9MICO